MPSIPHPPSKHTSILRSRTQDRNGQENRSKTGSSANPRPDALMKEQLVEMTGLSPRVVRVWFQNKRCKEKKRLREVSKVGRPPQCHGGGSGATVPSHHEELL